jgi:hypothetical protein
MRHQNVEQNHNTKADNKSCKKRDKVGILEADTNKSKLNHEEIKFVECLPQSGHNFLPYHLLSGARGGAVG